MIWRTGNQRKLLAMAAGWILLLFSSFGAAPPAASILYTNNFEPLAPGKLPEEFLVLDGNFSIRQEAGNKFMELPGAPLDGFGVLFGPAGSNGWTITAVIHGTPVGRRGPVFGPGLNGAAGYKLLSAPGKKALELWKGDHLLASVPFAWEAGWTCFKLQVRPAAEGKTRIAGKAWKKGTVEPPEWLLTVEDAEPLPAGRAALYGSPFSGTAIRFDDIQVIRSEGDGPG